MSGSVQLATKDPADVVEYTVTVEGLGADTIASVAYGTPTGITLPGSPAPSHTASAFTFWVSGGTDNADGVVRATITTTAGRVFGRTLVIPVRAL